MRKHFFQLSLALLTFFILLPIHLQAAPKTPALGIVTGGKAGTYYPFGQDMARLLAHYNMTLNVKTSGGSLANIQRLHKEKGVEFAIVQSDVLSFIQISEDDPVLQRYIKNLRILFPLYNEEIHILTRSAMIQDFADLQGKKIAVGSKTSGTNLTAQVLFNATGITPSEYLYQGGNKALEMVKKGQIDAMIAVMGAPGNLFKKIKPHDGLTLVPITTPELKMLYQPVTLTPSTYPWLREAVPTYAVKAVLMTYNYRYKCQQIGHLTTILYDQLSCLQAQGHPKWQQVDFDAPTPPGWQAYSCVETAMNKPRTYQGTSPCVAGKAQQQTSTSSPGTVLSTDCHDVCDRKSSGYNPISCLVCKSRQQQPK